MEHAQYVVSGWLLTGVAMAGYAAWMARRIGRAERLAGGGPSRGR